VIRTILAGAALAAALLLSGQPVKADWLCGPVQCVWVNYAVAAVPDYATHWTAPVAPNCFWKRGFFGRWKLICP
jgi:hypothetical protein